MKEPGGIQTNFMPMLLVKSLGRSFSCAWEGQEVAKATIKLKQKLVPRPD